MDYFERAKRLEEIPLLQKYYEEEKQLMKQVWEQQEQERVSDSILMFIFQVEPFMFFVFYPRDAMLVRVFATATCPDVCPSVRHAGIVPSRAKAGSWNVHHLIAPWL